MTARRRTDLTQLDDGELDRRGTAAARKLGALQGEVARREDIRRSGFRPERLKLFTASITATYLVEITALDAEGAERLLRDEERGIGAGALEVCNFEIDSVEEVTRARPRRGIGAM